MQQWGAGALTPVQEESSTLGPSRESSRKDASDGSPSAASKARAGVSNGGRALQIAHHASHVGLPRLACKGIFVLPSGTTRATAACSQSSVIGLLTLQHVLIRVTCGLPQQLSRAVWSWLCGYAAEHTMQITSRPSSHANSRAALRQHRTMSSQCTTTRLQAALAHPASVLKPSNNSSTRSHSLSKQRAGRRCQASR